MTTVHEGVQKFKGEIDVLAGAADVQTFVHNAIVAGPESFWKNDETVLYTRKVFAVVAELLKRDEVPSPIKDVVLGGVLLSDIAVHEVDEELHPIFALQYLNKAKEDFHEPLYDAIVKIVLTHEGVSPIKELAPKPGGPEHLVTLAHRVVQADIVEIKLP